MLNLIQSVKMKVPWEGESVALLSLCCGTDSHAFKDRRKRGMVEEGKDIGRDEGTGKGRNIQ